MLKISNGAEDRALLDAQNRAMERIGSTNLCPRLLVSAAGREIETVVAPSGTPHLVRLVTYLPGTPMGKVRRRTPGLLENVGRSVAQVDAALAGFDHPALRRDFHWDLARGLEVVRAGVGRIADRELAAVIGDLAGAFERHAAWRLADLRRSVIHNDANDFNVLVGGGDDLTDRNQHVVGLIDLGDMVHSYTVGDLAVAIAYAVLGEARPAGGREPRRARLPRASTRSSEDELAVLWGLATLRLCMSACIAADQRAQRPDNPYLGISQAPIRATLPSARTHPPGVAEAVLRVACGLPPAEKGPDIAAWLAANSAALRAGAGLGPARHAARRARPERRQPARGRRPGAQRRAAPRPAGAAGDGRGGGAGRRRAATTRRATCTPRRRSRRATAPPTSAHRAPRHRPVRPARDAGARAARRRRRRLRRQRRARRTTAP